MSKSERKKAEADAGKQVSVEEAFAQLSDIVEKMDEPEVTLEESMQLYRRGIELLNQCGDTLDRIEKEMITLTEEGEIPDGENEGAGCAD